MAGGEVAATFCPSEKKVVAADHKEKSKDDVSSCGSNITARSCEAIVNKQIQCIIITSV